MAKPAPTLPFNPSEPVRGFINGLTPVQHVAVRYLAAGWDEERVAGELKMDKRLIKKWMRDVPAFIKAYQEAVVAHRDVVESMLLVGEREAARTLIEALDATKSDKTPNWVVRVQAAMSLMDRAGERGRATERQQVAQVTAHVKADGQTEEALRRALRDPGVRAWLKESGQLAMMETEPAQIESITSAPPEPSIEINFYTEPPEESVA